MSNSNLFSLIVRRQRSIVASKAKSQSFSKRFIETIDEKIFRSKLSFRKSRIYRSSLSHRSSLFFSSFINRTKKKVVNFIFFSFSLKNDAKLESLLSLIVLRESNQLATKLSQILTSIINRSESIASNDHDNYDNLSLEFLFSLSRTLFKESSSSLSTLFTSTY